MGFGLHDVTRHTCGLETRNYIHEGLSPEPSYSLSTVLLFTLLS